MCTNNNLPFMQWVKQIVLTNSLKQNFLFTASPRKPRQIFFGPPTWNDVLGEGAPCLTSKGLLGACTSFKHCYPYFKIPDISIWEAWVLGNYDTCSFWNSEGRQAFGVCCSTSATTTTENPEDIDDFVQNKENNYPSWPPPIPTHPPDHTAPTVSLIELMNWRFEISFRC